MDAATIANPRALVQSAAMFFYWVFFRTNKSKNKIQPWPTNETIKTEFI